MIVLSGKAQLISITAVKAGTMRGDYGKNGKISLHFCEFTGGKECTDPFIKLAMMHYSSIGWGEKKRHRRSFTHFANMPFSHMGKKQL